MQDLLLWQHLNASELPPAEVLEPLLRDLIHLMPAQRPAFYGLLGRALSHPNHGVRQAALQELDACVHQFGTVVMGLVRRALGIK